MLEGIQAEDTKLCAQFKLHSDLDSGIRQTHLPHTLIVTHAAHAIHALDVMCRLRERDDGKADHQRRQPVTVKTLNCTISALKVDLKKYIVCIDV